MLEQYFPVLMFILFGMFVGALLLGIGTLVSPNRPDADKLSPYLDFGYRHLVAGFPAPYDEESMTRFANEVRPLLERG